MKQLQFIKMALSIAFAMTLIITAPLYTLAQTSGFSISPIVRRGEPSPDRGHFFNCDDCEGRINGAHAFNNKGEMGLAADTEGKCYDALFFFSPDGSSVLADSCSETPFGKLGYGWVNVNEQRQAVFLGLPLVNDRFVATLFLYTSGQLRKLVAEGDLTPAGGIFKGCGFSEPSINDKGEVAFGACADKDLIGENDGVYIYSEGQIRKVAIYGDPSPIGGFLALNFIPAITPILNNNSEVLFHGGVIIEPNIPEKYGLFLATKDGVKKIIVDGDPLTDGNIVFPRSLGIGDLNDKSEVVFTVKVQGKADTGIYLNANGRISKIMAQGDVTPIGGTFATLEDPDLIERFLFIRPRINANSAVAFQAKVIDGSSKQGIFLASPKAMLKVVAVGDTIPTGETIREIDTFALNDNSEVAFFAYGRKGHELPLGVFKATPVTPAIKKLKLKRKSGVLELRVIGNSFITNDTTIEINGVALEAMSYPEEAREDGGTTRQLNSRDARLEQLLTPGQTVQVKVFNSLTNRRSDEKAFTRQ